MLKEETQELSQKELMKIHQDNLTWFKNTGGMSGYFFRLMSFKPNGFYIKYSIVNNPYPNVHNIPQTLWFCAKYSDISSITFHHIRTQTFVLTITMNDSTILKIFAGNESFKDSVIDAFFTNGKSLYAIEEWGNEAIKQEIDYNLKVKDTWDKLLKNTGEDSN